MKIFRSAKQTTILTIYLILLALVSLLIYNILKPDPTCFDGKQNQREEGVDCGGPCQPCEEEINAQDLKVMEKAFVYGGPKKYDVMAKISNPNDQYGSPKFSYKFITG